jgi:ferredoxin
MPNVRFQKGDQIWEIEVEDGTTLLEAARDCDAPVQTLCNGVGACIQCRVRIIEGFDALSKPEALEKDRMGNIFHLTRERMGCQAHVEGDVVVEVLEVRLPARKKSRFAKRPRRN